MEAPMTAADVGAVIGNRGDGMMNGGFWIFALIVLAFMGNGGWGFGGNRGGSAVTEADLCNANSFNELKSQVGRMSDQQTAIAMQEQRDLCTGLNAVVAAINENKFAAQQCCCETKQLIEAKFCDLESRMAAQREQELRDKVAQLEMDQRFCGVPRLPLNFTYAVQPNFGCGCNNGCNTLF